MAEKLTESQARATAKYHKEHTKFMGFRFNLQYDWDILAKFKSLKENGKESQMGYLKRLIRDDIKKTGFDPGPMPGSVDSLPPVEPVPTVDMDEWRKEHPDQIPPEELSKEEALKLLGM